MKKGSLSLITLLVVLHSAAQQNSQQRPAPVPVPDCGAPIPPLIFQSPGSQTICPGSNAVFIASAYSRGPYWQMSTDNGISWTFVPANSYLSPFNEFIHQPDTLIVFSVGTNMNGYLFRCNYAGICNASAYTNAATLTVATINPEINNQPINVSICKSTSADFSVTASGSSLHYQWQQSPDGNTFTNLSGKTNNSLSIDSVTLAMNNYQYRCIISSDCAPTVTSIPAVLTVRNENTSILTQPVTQRPCVGDSGILSVVAQGNNLSYQWELYGSSQPIPGANTATLRLPYTESNLAYRCRIESSCKTLYSDTASITPLYQPGILPSQENTLCPGEQVQFSAMYPYEGYPAALQWQVSIDSGITYTDIAGETTNFLSITASSSLNGNRYRCRIANNCFNGFSSIHKLYSVIETVSIINQPQNTETCVGNNIGFSTTVTGGRLKYYLWQQSTDNGVHYNDISGTSYNFNPIDFTLFHVSASQNNNLYRCKIVTACGDTIYSNAAILKVNANPELGNNASVNVNCDTCTVNISNVYNTASFTSAVWNTTSLTNVLRGKYLLKVFNEHGCYDDAFAFVNMIKDDTIRICKGSIVNFSSSITGTSYQWEWDYGLGFVQLYNSLPGDEISISGATGPVLTINGLSFSGRVRCKVNNGSYSNPINFILTAYWTGAVDNAWENPSNWSCGEVPNYQTEVIILGDGNFIPEINADAACKKLFLKKNATININATRKLKIGPNEW